MATKKKEHYEIALITPSGLVSRYANTKDTDPEVATKEGWKWLPVETVEVGFGSVRSVPTIEVQRGKVVRTVTLRAPTAGEIDAERRDVMARIPEVVITVLLDQENRLRALEGQEPISEGQFKYNMRQMI